MDVLPNTLKEAVEMLNKEFTLEPDTAFTRDKIKARTKLYDAHLQSIRASYFDFLTLN